ncbi:MAG: hypothetical protein ACKPKO_03925, partial [Candidatus Fonsibacter sp.]
MAQDATPSISLPFPWAISPPWRTVSRKSPKAKEESGETEKEVAWVCAACYADHHNSRKQTCRICGEARSPKGGTKGRSAQKKAPAPKAAPSLHVGKPKESDEEVPRFPVPKQMCEYIVKTGHKLHT